MVHSLSYHRHKSNNARALGFQYQVYEFSLLFTTDTELGVTRHKLFFFLDNPICREKGKYPFFPTITRPKVTRFFCFQGFPYQAV